jgi:hypothetical protein
MPILPFFSKLSPWWLRLAALLLFGMPIFTGWPIETIAAYGMPFASTITTEPATQMFIDSISAWTLYAGFIWIVVFLNIGAHSFKDYVSVAFFLALTTAVLGLVVRKILPFIDGQTSSELINFKMAKLFIIIMSTVPFTLMSINMFSSKNLLIIAQSRSEKSKTSSDLYLHLCLALRMMQHVGEVVVRLLDVWREEHPSLLVPRHHRDWRMKWYSSANFFPWAVDAVSAWIFACMMITFAPLPSFVHELQSIKSINAGSGKGEVQTVDSN